MHLHATKIGEAGDIERIANLIIGSGITILNRGYRCRAKRNGQNCFYSDTIYTTILKKRIEEVEWEEMSYLFNGNTGKISKSKQSN
jgi:hypothetical protein